MAGFVQIIEYRTSKPDEIAALGEEFRAKREADDGAGPTRGFTCADRDEPGRYFTIVEFNSYEEAMENSGRADTNEFAEKMTALSDGPVRYYNLDLVETLEYR